MLTSVFDPCSICGWHSDFGLRASDLRLGVVEAAVFAVRRIAWLAAAKMARRPNFAVALFTQQLDEPGFMLHFFVQDASGHVVGARIFAKGQVANFAPGANGASFRF